MDDLEKLLDPVFRADLERAHDYAKGRPSWAKMADKITGKSDEYKITYFKARQGDLQHLLYFLYHESDWCTDGYFELIDVYASLLDEVKEQLRELEQMSGEETPAIPVVVELRQEINQVVIVEAPPPNAPAGDTTAAPTEGQPARAEHTQEKKDDSGAAPVGDEETQGESKNAIEGHPLYSEWVKLEKCEKRIVALDVVRRQQSSGDKLSIGEACKEAARIFLPRLSLGPEAMRKGITKYLKDEYNQSENLDGFSFMKLVERAMKDLELIQFVELADLLTGGNACETSENGDY